MKELKQIINQLSTDELVSYIQWVWDSSPYYFDSPKWHRQIAIINQIFWYSQFRYAELTGRYYKINRIVGRK